MSKRASLSVSAAAIATLAICLPARAAGTAAAPAQTTTQAPTQVPTKTPPPAPAPHPAPADDPFRCHPSQDIACTIVRETVQGTLIVTVRPKGRSGTAPAWTVVSGAPPSAGPHPGGTVYVVPSSGADGESTFHQAALMTSNGAPILD
jgi:hypothetical protein